MTHGKKRCRLQLLFFYITDLHSPIMILIYSMNYTTSTSCWSFIDAVLFGLHRLRVSVPESCPISNACLQPLDRVLETLPVCVSYATIVSLLPLASRWYKVLSVSCMLSQSVTASFSMVYCFWLYSTLATA